MKRNLKNYLIAFGLCAVLSPISVTLFQMAGCSLEDACRKAIDSIVVGTIAVGLFLGACE